MSHGMFVSRADLFRSGLKEGQLDAQQRLTRGKQRSEGTMSSKRTPSAFSLEGHLSPFADSF